MEMRKSILVSILLFLSLVSKSQSYFSVLMGQDASAVTYATFNSSYMSSTSVLSNGNLTVNNGTSNGMAVSTIGSSTTGISGTDKVYCEITVNASGTNRDIGVLSTLSPSSFNTWVGNQTATTGWGYYSTGAGGFTGAFFNGGGVTNNYFSADYTTGDVIGLAIDAGGNTLKYYKNGTLLTPTVTLSGGNYFIAVSSANGIYILNSGQSSFTGTVPAGYLSGWYR